MLSLFLRPRKFWYVADSGRWRGKLNRGAHSAHVSPLDLGSVKDIYLCRPLGGSNRNYSGPRSGLAHDLHIRLKQYPRVSAAVGRFNAAGAPAE